MDADLASGFAEARDDVVKRAVVGAAGGAPGTHARRRAIAIKRASQARGIVGVHPARPQISTVRRAQQHRVCNSVIAAGLESRAAQ